MQFFPVYQIFSNKSRLIMDSNVRKLLFIQKCPQFSQKWSASSAGMLATFSMSEHKNIKIGFKHQHPQPSTFQRVLRPSGGQIFDTWVSKSSQKINSFWKVSKFCGGGNQKSYFKTWTLTGTLKGTQQFTHKTVV